MTERVYLAGRLVDERSPHRADLLELVQGAFPDAEILDGVGFWSSNEDWLASWHELLPHIDRVILVPGSLGEVGLGGLQEVVDAWIAGIPVEVVTAEGVRPLERLMLGTEVQDLERVAVAR
jgi:hypothetical protein